MERIASEFKLCLICMDQHPVDTVTVTEEKNINANDVSYTALYEYCRNADEYLETEDVMKKNQLARHEAYRQLQSAVN